MTNGRCEKCGGEWFLPAMKPSPSGTFHTPAYPDAVVCLQCHTLYPVNAITSAIDPENARRPSLFNVPGGDYRRPGGV